MKQLDQLKMNLWAYEIKLIVGGWSNTDLQYMANVLGISQDALHSRISRLINAGYLEDCAINAASQELVVDSNHNSRDSLDYDLDAFLRCKNCGTLISSQDEYCLFCGKINKMARMNSKQINDFNDAYTEIKHGIRMVNSCSKGIDDTELSDSFESMVSKIKKMCEYVSNNKQLQCDADVKRLLDFYLPKVFESINDFRELYENEEDQDKMNGIINELKYTVDAVNTVFDDIFDKINNAKILDLSSDLVSLRNMIELNGSGKGDF